MSDSENEDPPWKKELMMRKSAVSRTFQKSAEACHRTGSSIPTEKERHSVRIPPTNRNVAPVIKRQLRSASSKEDRKMPGTGAEVIVRHGNLVDVNHTNSDSTFSECGRSPTFCSSQSDAFSFESDISSSINEELEYGPGIVNKLKSRFIHLTLKETERANSMIPPATNSGKLRRYASLEGLVDNNISLKLTHVEQHYDYSQNNSGNRNHYYQNYSTRRSSMKKARSMDNLGSSNLDRPIYPSMNKSNTYDCDLGMRSINPILINENVVIIESIGNKKDCDKFCDIDIKNFANRPILDICKSPGIEHDEMPKPDTVKTFKQLFEAKKSLTNGSNDQIVKQKAPKVCPSNLSVNDVNSRTYDKAFHSSAEEQKPLIDSVSNLSKSKLMVNGTDTSAKSACETTSKLGQHELSSVKGIDQKDGLGPTRPNVQSDVKALKPTLTSHTFNDRKDIRNDPPVKDIPICSETSNVLENDMDQAKLANLSQHKIKLVDLNSKSSDVLKPLPYKPPKVISVHAKIEEKPVANIKPIVNAQINDDRKNKSKNNKNANKTESFQNKINVASTEEKLVNALSSLPKPRTWHKSQESGTSIVFDFRDRKDVKPHISNKVAPFGCRPAFKKPSGVNIDGIDGQESNDYDDDEDDGVISMHVEPCNVEFEGANIISGKSAMLSNRNKKLKIQFDDKATSTFEYPSETYVDSENSSPSPTDQSVIPYADDDESDCKTDDMKNNKENSPPLASPILDPSNGSSLKSTPAIGSGSLSSYTPSSLCKQAENYTLGISRHVPDPVPPLDEKQEKSETEDTDAEDYLKPAEADQTSSWSSSASSDLLF